MKEIEKNTNADSIVPLKNTQVFFIYVLELGD